MIEIDIRDNFPEVKRQLATMQDDLANKAAARALNKTIVQGRTEMARRISREYMLSSSQAKQRLQVTRSKRTTLGLTVMLAATTKGKGRSMNLIAFVEKKVSLAEAKRRLKKGTLQQLQFQIKRQGGKKMIKGAFIGNDGRTVFIRVPGQYMKDRVNKKGNSKHAEAIRALNTIDVPQMFNAKRINVMVREVMLDKFEANFEREARAVLLGYVK